MLARSRFVFEAHDKMDGVVADLVGGYLGLEIKRAETAFTAANRVKFRIEVKDAPAGVIDDAQIRIARALNLSGTPSLENRNSGLRGRSGVREACLRNDCSLR